MKAVLIVLIVALCGVLAQNPTRPAVSDQFYAEVHVSLNDNNRFLSGGGVLAYDVPNGKGRTDFKLENSDHRIETIHILERYDIHEIFEIVDNQNCITTTAAGTIMDPFAWVGKAVFNGTTDFQNKPHDIWALTSTEGSSTIDMKLYVAADNVNVPVYYTVHNMTGKNVNDVAITFYSFSPKEPESWVFSIPTTCNNSLTGGVGGCNSGTVVYWANANWNCGDVSCSYRVPDGAAQPGYACAEFTARSLAAGGYMINLQPTDPQSDYANFRGYNLCDVGGLNDFCSAVGTYTAHPATASAVQAAYAVMGNGGDGAWSHACIGVGSGVDDCHNIAREDHPASGSFYLGVNAVWAPPGC